MIYLYVWIALQVPVGIALGKFLKYRKRCLTHKEQHDQ